MNGSANVSSIEAIRHFKGTLLGFEEGAAHALSNLQQEIFRALDWLENDRPGYWQEQIRRGYDAVAETRIIYERCRMKTVGEQQAACLEEKQAWQTAQQRLATAQDKLKTVQRWTIRIHQEIDEYRGRIGRLQRCIETDVPHMATLLERMLDSLDIYASVSRRRDATDNATADDVQDLSPDQSSSKETSP